MDKSALPLSSDANILTISISSAVKDKLQTKHKIKPEWITGCFQNRHQKYLVDQREQHRTVPETRWFIAEYEPNKQLKVCFIYRPDRQEISIKTAYPPCEKELEIYLSAA